MGIEGTLSNAWDQHLASEFAAKSAEEALATMSPEPYVNVVPLMIGARGRTELHDLYANHLLSQIPSEMEMDTVSRRFAGVRCLLVALAENCDKSRDHVHVETSKR
jgi:hypothetical protein